MAASRSTGGGGGRLNEDPLVAALVPDPNGEFPDSAVLHGYVGKSTNAGIWRLYLDPALTSYVEVSEGDILHHRQVPGDGGTLMWVRKSLELKVTRVSSATIQAEFLSGSIAGGRMRPAGRTNVAFQAVASVGCPSILNTCLTQILPCPSDGCTTWDACPPPPPTPTVLTWCKPSEFGPLCTLWGFG